MKILLALGGNIGDVPETFIKTKNLLEKVGFCVIKESSLYKTEPIGPEQDWYTNQVIEVSCPGNIGGKPEHILDSLQKIEYDLGRTREIKWGPRTIDIDILFIGNRIYESDRLNIPHIELHKRSFVLVPLVEKWPEFVHPVFKKIVKELLSSLPESQQTKVLTV